MPDNKKDKSKTKEEAQKKKYLIKGTDFRFKGKTYPENTHIELTHEEYKREKNNIQLIPTKAKKEDTNGTNA